MQSIKEILKRQITLIDFAWKKPLILAGNEEKQNRNAFEEKGKSADV